MPTRRDRLELLLASSLMLFVELVLIRWTGANVVYLSYFSNFILLGSFLGIGVGFLRARRGPNLFSWAPVILAFFAAFVKAFPVVIDRSGDSLVFFSGLEEHGLPIWVMLPAIFVAVAAVMAAIAHGVATRFARFTALEAYRLDILGSILGIALYSLLAFLSTPPIAWAVVIGAMFVILLGDQRRTVQWLSIVALLVVFAYQSFDAGTVWSPYYRIDAIPGQGPDGSIVDIRVNAVPHQLMRAVESDPATLTEYGQPYRDLLRAPGSVLIVGAGTGNDVAMALRQGAHHVDAVEIDPRLLQIGVDQHPDRPYQDPRVTRIVTDGRAYLENTDRSYHLILFALPDSLTLVSGQSAIRLESYLFTREAVEAARARLNVGGAFSMYNFYREDWLVDRLAGTLQDVFGRAPCEHNPGSGGGVGEFSILVDAEPGSSLACETTWNPGGRSVVAPATDDRPFVYLRTRAIPSRYLWTLALVLLASAAPVRGLGGTLRTMRGSLDLFFMGAAFLLLETKSVVQFALLFGTTWFVNALVFAGILITVLMAVEVERLLKIRRRGILFALLFVGLAITALVPSSALLSLSPIPRFVAATALAFFPVFIANLVFAGRFREAGDPTTAFGANLLGAMAGGTLEYLSLITGYRALLVIAAALYALAWAFMRRPIATATDETTWSREAESVAG
jgi:SAM-dependent methyltransferase